MAKYTISDESHLTTLESHLKDNLYIGGNFPNADDACVFEQFVNAKSDPNQETHLNLWSWFSLIAMYTPQIRETWKSVVAKTEQAKGGKPKKEEPKKEEPKKDEKKDDDLDLFGDDDGADDKAALEELQKKKEKEKSEKKKDLPIAKSLIILDIKVWEPEQDLDALAKRVISDVVHDGLFWKTEYQLKDVAFGVKKITIGCVVEDAKVSIDDVIDEICAWEDDVQSIDIVCFNKI
jgi:elongation factor 1-beta